MMMHDHGSKSRTILFAFSFCWKLGVSADRARLTEVVFIVHAVRCHLLGISFIYSCIQQICLEVRFRLLSSLNKQIRLQIHCYSPYLLVAALASATTSQECVLCAHSDIAEPGKVLNISFVTTSGALNSTIGLFLTDDDPKCTFHQSVSSICGCAPPDNACNLCSNGQTLGLPNRKLAFIANQFGFIPTCEIFDAHLKGTVNASSRQCLSTQSFLGDYYGCGSVLLSTSVALITTPKCTLCPSGESVPLPEQNLNIRNFPYKTCRNFDLAVSSLYEATSKACSASQSISSLCGCSLQPQEINPCSLCRDGSKSPAPNVTITPLWQCSLPSHQRARWLKCTCRPPVPKQPSCSGLQVYGSYCSCPPLIDSCHDQLMPLCPNSRKSSQQWTNQFRCCICRHRLYADLQWHLSFPY